MFHPRRITPPAVQPVSLADAKWHLRYEDTDQDTRIEALIAAAVRHLDGWAGTLRRCLIDQVWERPLACFPPGHCIILPFPDCKNIAMRWTDVSGVEQPLTTLPFIGDPVETGKGTLVQIGKDFTRPALADLVVPVIVRFTAGYGATPADVPEPIRGVILEMVADAFRFRETAMLGPASALPIFATAARRLGDFRFGVTL